MLESLEANISLAKLNTPALPSVQANGRIRLPGFPPGASSDLPVESYLPLVHLYANILEAGRILDRYRSQLRRNPGVVSLADQNPVTELTSSGLRLHLFYKREDQTITRAYKVRGAVVGMAKRMQTDALEKFMTVSTGNHALGVLKAAELLRPASVRLVIPENTAPHKVDKIQLAMDKLRRTNVRVDLLYKGRTFDKARSWALQHQHRDEYYLDPYSDPWVVAGQGTLGLELVQQVGQVLKEHSYKELLLISPVGGGGLLTGTATALRMAVAWEPAFRDVALHFKGLRLENLESALGDAIRVHTVAESNLELLNALNVPLETVSDEQMAVGVDFVKSDLGHRIEGASGAAVAWALEKESCKPTGNRLVICLLSGGNV